MIRWPKAIAKKITEHVGVLAFYDYPAEHWIHLRTTTPIGRPSPPSGCVMRHQGTRSRAAGVARAFKLIESAQAH